MEFDHYYLDSCFFIAAEDPAYQPSIFQNPEAMKRLICGYHNIDPDTPINFEITVPAMRSDCIGPEFDALRPFRVIVKVYDEAEGDKLLAANFRKVYK